MQRIIPITVIAVATFAAAAAVWFWALRPLGFASYLSSTSATDADIIRQYWPHRLLEPEWISATPDRLDRLMKWHIYETAARLSVVGVLWFIIAGGAIYRFVRGQRLRPNLALLTRPSRSGCSPRVPWAGSLGSLGIIARTMKILAVAVLASITFAAMSAPQPTAVRAAKQVILSRTDYDVAEVIFLRFLADSTPMKADTNSLRLLSYGPADSDLPAEFLGRFRSNDVSVTNASAGEIREIKRSERSERVLAEKNGSREGLGIGLRTLTATKDGAEATVVSVSSGITVVTWTVRLKRDGLTWKVTEKVQRSISCFG